MVTPLKVISGVTGPYTGQVGGYGRNAASNVKTYVSAPAEGSKGPASSPLGPLMNPAILAALAGLFSGKPANPQDLMNMLKDSMKDMMPGNRPLPDVQYSTQPDVGMADVIPPPISYDDALAFSSEMMKAPATVGPLGTDPSVPSTPVNDKFGEILKPLLPVFKQLLGDQGGPIIDQLEKVLNGKPDELMDEMIKNNPMLSGMKDLLPGGAKSGGLSKEILDRDKDGKVSLAEKAAETLFMDDSVGLLQSELALKMNGGLNAQDDFDKMMVFEAFQNDLSGQTSAFDGKITVDERKWAMKAAENKFTADLVGEALDNVLLTHDLVSRATTFESTEL